MEKETIYYYVERLELELEIEWTANKDNELDYEIVSIDGEPIVGIQEYILLIALTSNEQRKIELECY